MDIEMYKKHMTDAVENLQLAYDIAKDLNDEDRIQIFSTAGIGNLSELAGIYRDAYVHCFSLHHDVNQFGKAVKEKDILYVKLQLLNGMDVSVADTEGVLPLMYAVLNKDETMVEILLEHGADPNQNPALYDYALGVALHDNQYGLTKLLLKYKADPNIMSKMGMPFIELAVENGNPDCVKELLEHKADPNGSWMSEGNPIVKAAKRGHIDIVKILIDFGASTEYCGNYDQPVLEVVREYDELYLTSYRDEIEEYINKRTVAGSE